MTQLVRVLFRSCEHWVRAEPLLERIAIKGTDQCTVMKLCADKVRYLLWIG